MIFPVLLVVMEELPAVALVLKSRIPWLEKIAVPAVAELVKVTEPDPVTSKSPAVEEFWNVKFPSLLILLCLAG